MKLEEYLIIIGAVFAVIAGLTSITTGKPLITLLTGFTVDSSGYHSLSWVDRFYRRFDCFVWF